MWVYAGKTLEKGNCWNQTCSWKTPLNKWLLEIASLVSETTLSLTKHFVYVFFLNESKPNSGLCPRTTALCFGLASASSPSSMKFLTWSNTFRCFSRSRNNVALNSETWKNYVVRTDTWINFSSSCYCSVNLKNLNPSDRRFKKSFLKGL